MVNREQMNIVIVGHVDHGKSTVIGRLLADTDSLPEGKLQSVKDFCLKNAKPFEYAFLLDALKDEQAQGITIDTARCFFKTNRRDYIIIDAPGHIEFLKNMVTGASRAEAALLVIDANEGIQENSKRHGHIVAMLGIKQVVVLVNKMDLIQFDKAKFKAIKEEFTEFLSKNKIKPIEFIPISAFNGDNIANNSFNTSWYKGPNVLTQLDSFKNKKNIANNLFRMPVQDIYKFTKEGDNRRIVAGTIISGNIDINEEVVFLPSFKKSVIENIEGFNKRPQTTAYTHEATGLTLKTQIYIKPGELMVKANDTLPHVSSRFRANIFWVGKSPLIKGKNYKLKIFSLKISVQLKEIINIIDSAELNIDRSQDQVKRHDVAECIFETAKPIAFDTISECEETGRFVIVDNFDIAGGGIILDREDDKDKNSVEDIESKKFIWDKSLVLETERALRYGHKSKFIIITSGDEIIREHLSKISKMLERKLFVTHVKTCFLGIPNQQDQIFGGDDNNLTARNEQLRRIGEIARILYDSGLIIITSIFNLDDLEANNLIHQNQLPNPLVINIGESPFNKFEPTINIKNYDFTNNDLVNDLYQFLVQKEILFNNN